MDTILIERLRVETIIGIHDWERRLLRPLFFDLALGTDIREAAASDRIRDALDYATISERVAEIARREQPELIETLAERIARELFRDFPILSLKLRIDKPGAVTSAHSVGVEIERRREDYAVCGR
jgi:dihydroneopterin aldolase